MYHMVMHFGNFVFFQLQHMFDIVMKDYMNVTNNNTSFSLTTDLYSIF